MITKIVFLLFAGLLLFGCTQQTPEQQGGVSQQELTNADNAVSQAESGMGDFGIPQTDGGLNVSDDELDVLG